MSKQKKLGPFDFLNNVNLSGGKKDLLPGVKAEQKTLPDPDSPEKAYVPFMINRGLSNFQDTVLFANEMNRAAHLPARMQYDFLRYAIRPKKRFSKWFKAKDDSDDVKLIMEHYGYSATKAREALILFDRKSLNTLRAKLEKGGSI